jgi:N-acetylmuramoyl-L-alanine amidase
MRQIAIFFWVLGLSFKISLVHATPAQIQQLTFSSQHPGRVSFQLEGTPHYKYFTLKNPSRLVVDFENTGLVKAIDQPPANHGLAVGARTALRNKADLRVVLELNADADAKVTAANSGQGLQLQFDMTAKPTVASISAVEVPVKKTPMPAENHINTAVILPSKPEKKPAVTSSSKLKGRSIVIAIDAGHGGKDVGAQGANGTQEKDVVLAIAKRLQSAVNRQPGMKAVMIRNDDNFVKLRERVNIAQRAKADLFVSIHADAFDDTSAHGASVYTLANNGASSQGAQFLADSENAADGGHEIHDEMLASVLMDLSHKASKEASQHIGSKVLRSVKSVGHLHRASVQKAGFVVLKSPIPSILVETAFISNPEEERRLNTRAYQDKMASAIFTGVVAHFKQYAPADTLFAQLQKSGKTGIQLAARDDEPEQQVVISKSEKPGASRSEAVVVAINAQTKHVISNGETLSGIAHQYGVSMRDLRHANGMEDGKVKIGQVLQIPRSS